jgi:hypothetical protein
MTRTLKEVIIWLLGFEQENGHVAESLVNEPHLPKIATTESQVTESQLGTQMTKSHR